VLPDSSLFQRVLVTGLLCCFNFCGVVTAQIPGKVMPEDLLPVQDLSAQGKILYKQFFKPGLKYQNAFFSSATLYNRGLYSNEFLTTNYFVHQNSTFSLGVDVAGIPFQASYTRRMQLPLPWVGSEPRNWFKISFDANAYLNKWKAIAEKLGPGLLTQSGRQLADLKKTLGDDILHSVKKQASLKLQHQLDSIAGNLDPASLATQSPEQLGRLFFGQDLNGEYENALQELNRIKNRDSVNIDDSSLRAATEKLEQASSKLAYVKTVHEKLVKAKESGAIDKLKTLQSNSLKEYDALLKDPQQLAAKLGSRFNLGGIQKWLTMLSGFKLGGQASPFGGNLPMLSNGISMEMNTGDKYLAFSTGKLISVGNEWNYLAGQPVTEPDKKDPSFWSVNYRKGKLNSDHKGIKISSLSGGSSPGNSYVPSGPGSKNLLLINLYSRERLFGNTWIGLEATKSAATGGLPKQDLLNLSNMSYKLTVDGTMEKQGINHQLWFNKLSGAFNDLSGFAGYSGGYESGLSFQWRPLKKKWSTGIRGGARHYEIPGVNKTGSWDSRDLKTNFTYRFKHGQYVKLSSSWRDGFRLYEFNSERKIIHQESTGGSSEFYLVNKRIFGLYNTSLWSLGYSRENFPLYDSAGSYFIHSNAYNVLLNQTFLLGDHVLQCNVLYTKVTQARSELLFNTRLDADAGGTFRLSEKFSLGTAAVFGYFKSAYTNIGLRTTISARLAEKFSVDFCGDFRQNIKIENPLFDQFCNVSCDLKYSLK
jgi:hypothetical protein